MQELPEQQQQQEEEEEEEELQQEEEQQGVNSIELLPSGVLFGRIFWPFFLSWQSKILAGIDELSHMPFQKSIYH